MRPVNLIPPAERHGAAAPTRTGPLAYIFVGVLALALVAITAIVMVDNKVDERQAEIAVLEGTAAESQARAASLASYTTFQQIHDARVLTVDGLARSRFDWERVLRELSRVLPRHVWLTEMAGTVTPGVDGGGENAGLRDGVSGPALELSGCGRSHSDIARLVAAMEDIDGVTRVAASDSAKPGDTAAGAGGDSCQTRSSIPQFHLIAAFDEVVAGASAPAPALPAPGAETAPVAADARGSAADGTPSGAQQQKIDTATGIAGTG